MYRTALVLDSRFALHIPCHTCPEVPERIVDINRILLSDKKLSSLRRLVPVEEVHEWITSVHSKSYYQRFFDASVAGSKYLDTEECSISPMTFSIAELAVGAALSACDSILQKQASHVFCGVRPPGHHAEKGEAMGFCYFNNAAIAATYLRAKNPDSKVFILDWDVHHGNGTQHAFEEDPCVFFCSIHASPLYPGTGDADEVGRGPGKGTTLNIPVPHGSGDDVYRRAFDDNILPALRMFSPDFIIISAGFDAHKDDSLGPCKLESNSYHWMTTAVCEAADESGVTGIISILEGGYNLVALAESVYQHVSAFQSFCEKRSIACE